MTTVAKVRIGESALRIGTDGTTAVSVSVNFHSRSLWWYLSPSSTGADAGELRNCQHRSCSVVSLLLCRLATSCLTPDASLDNLLEASAAEPSHAQPSPHAAKITQVKSTPSGTESKETYINISICAWRWLSIFTPQLPTSLSQTQIKHFPSAILFDGTLQLYKQQT